MWRWSINRRAVFEMKKMYIGVGPLDSRVRRE